MKINYFVIVAIVILVAFWIYSKWSSLQYKSGQTAVALPDPEESGEGTIGISNALLPAAVANTTVKVPYNTSSSRPLTTGVVASRDAIAVESTGLTPQSVVGIPPRQINQVVGPNVVSGNASYTFGNPNTSPNASYYFGG